MLLFTYLCVLDRKVSIQKMRLHKYRDNLFDGINYCREFLIIVYIYLNIVSMGTDCSVLRFSS